MNEIKVLDLFSGIGGFSLGLERAGPFRTVAFCEREPFCQAVLKKHWPEIPIYDDVRTIPTDGLGGIDLICGGFPCQPWSVAGQQRGAEDDRDLWPEMVRLVEELQPRFLIGENVRGFVNEPLGLERSLSDLESIGYQAVPFIIPACAVDAPHRRERVWILANAHGQFCRTSGSGEAQAGAAAPTSPASQQPTSLANPRRIAAGNSKKMDRSQAKWRKANADTSNGGQDVANAEDNGLQRLRNLTESNPAGSRQKQPLGDSDESGFTQPCRWSIEPDVGRVAHGVPRRVDRLKALGNAVVPQVVEQIGRAIMSANRDPA